MFVYEGDRVNFKVTGAKNVKNLHSRIALTSEPYIFYGT